MENNEKNIIRDGSVMIRISDLKKKYLLGRLGAGSLQGAIKEWRERRKNPEQGKIDRKRKNTFFYALDGINLEVRKGETIGIIGQNGAGKSTLLKILSRITAPTEGYVDLYGRVTSMLEVGTGFHGDMTGRENIYLNGAILGMTKAEIDAKIEDIISFAELEDFIDTPIKKYSSGMYVKLGFSVAYHLDSEILIMDEVLAVGDVKFQQKCLGCLAEAAREGKRTILYVSHNMSTVRQLCDRCIVLAKGHIVFDGDTDQAIERYLGVDSLMLSKILFSQEHRPDDHIVRERCFFSMDALELCDRREPVFKNSEDAVLDLTCTAMTSLRNVGFRFEFWYQDNTKVATALSRNFVDFEVGTETIRVCLSLRSFVPGSYRADIVAFVFDGSPNERKIDAVYPGITLQIEPTLNQKNYLEWNHKHWGAIRLEDAILEKKS